MGEHVTFPCYSSAPGASPQSLAAYNTSAFSVYAHWQEVIAEKRHGIVQGYKLSIYELTKEGVPQNLENRTNELSLLEANFTGLKPFRNYRIEVLGFNSYGDGPFATVEVKTDESC